MKKILIILLAAVSVALRGVSQLSTNVSSEEHFFQRQPDQPDWFSSEKELREKIRVEESHEYAANGKTFLVCLSSPPYMSVAREKVTCWYRPPNSQGLFRVWEVRLVGGTIKFDYDKKTTRLSLLATSNISVADTPMEGQTLASVVLAFLPTERASSDF